MNQSYVSQGTQGPNWYHPDEISFLYTGNVNPIIFNIPMDKTQFTSLVIDKFHVDAASFTTAPQGSNNVYLTVDAGKCKFQPDGQRSNIVSSIEPYPGTTIYHYDPARYDSGEIDPFNQQVVITLKDVSGNTLSINPNASYTIGITIATYAQNVGNVL